MCLESAQASEESRLALLTVFSAFAHISRVTVVPGMVVHTCNPVPALERLRAPAIGWAVVAHTFGPNTERQRQVDL